MRVRPKTDIVRGLLWWVPGCLVFFRNAFTSGFDRITGDDGDGRLVVFVHEHWVQVARGHVSWTSPAIFHPVRNALGYSDTHLLNEVFYLPLRGAGLDMFLAFQWTIILLSLVGFVSLFVFLRRALGLASATCAALATTFTFANNLYNTAGHSQLYAVCWLPLLLLLLLRTTTARDRKARLARGWSAGALLGLLFYSSYYIAWFATLAALGFALVVLVWRLSTRGFAVVIQSLRRHAAAAVGAAVGFGLAMIPFAITYLPALRLFPDRQYNEAMTFAAWPSDVINLGPSNYVWGSALRSTLSGERLFNGEVWMALTPLLMLTALVSCVAIVVRRRSVAVGFAGEACVACGIVLACATVLPMKFGTKSPWAIAYAFVPGAKALRAIDRIAVIGGLFAVIIIGIAIRSLRDVFAADAGHRRRWHNVALAALLGLIVVEQLNLGQGSTIDRSKQLYALIVAPDPPAACRAFYITDIGPNPVVFYISTIDAMLISQHFEIPTVNGYSGQVPPGYDFLDPASVGYVDRVHVWADAHGVLEGLCSHDRVSREWSGPEPSR